MAPEARLDDLVAQARGASEASAVVDVIGRATAAQGVYVFGELLQLPSVQQLGGSPQEPHLRLLELFAYGTWADYRAHGETLPPLSESQQRKLRALSVVSAASGAAAVGLASLGAALDLPDRPELESLLINDCLYAGLVEGILDQEGGRLCVTGCAPRDVRPSQLADVAAGVRDWLADVTVVLASLESSAAAALAGDAATAASSAAHAATLAAEREAVRQSLEATREPDAAAPAGDADAFAAPASSEETPPGIPRHSKRRR